MKTQKIYVIRTEGDVEGKSTRVLGYATGKEEDIKAYYDDKRYYNLYLDLETLLDIGQEAVTEKRQLLKEKSELEKKLEKINSTLKEM